MIRQSIFLLLFTLLFTACVERGQTLKPTINRTMSEPIAPLVLHHNNVKKTPSIQKSTIQNNTPKDNKIFIMSKTKKVSESTQNMNISSEELDEMTHEKDSFFIWSDETKNKISGFFVIIIGIIILI